MPSSSPTRKACPPGLYVVATPIGNLADITRRALTILAEVDLIAAEDTRHTRRLLAAHRIENRLISYHEHNEVQRTAGLIEQLIQGAAIALVSNAGTPTVSDPGFRLVQAAVQHQIPVTPIPGASAAITGLSAAGLPTDQFVFVGFPARKKARRLEQIRSLANLPFTLIFYQSPQRLADFIDELKEGLGDRQAVLGREMTKVHEEFLRGSLSHIAGILGGRETIKGECTLLVAGASQAAVAVPADLDAALRPALEKGGPLSEIAREVASRLNLSRKEVYERALKIKDESGRMKDKG
ncbi:MAG: 16S rRNA (cytidine(1402)-2'-O)-methyltransferase [Desulfobacteraceae bacterium]|nr:MAG: 16S rRNA (cytidine(1402)-2'-O)-methyltransferase [Desulfobacteraceae bacterium]